MNQKTPQRPLTPTEQRQMASEMHVWILDGLASKTPWTIEDLAFQGGTSLALAWDSPRFSEDLDFIVRDNLEFSGYMKKILQHVENGLQRNFPGAKVTLKEKESQEQNVYMFSAELPNVLGKTKVKTEFWKVRDDFVKAYDRDYKQVARRGTISPQLPVASLDQIHADKMVALGARDRFKWRDAYDLWFLSTTHSNIFSNKDEFVSWIDNTLSLYNTGPEKLYNGWKELIETPEEIFMESAIKDLKPFLSEQLWDKLFPKQIQFMVSHLKDTLQKAMDYWPPKEYQGLSSQEFKQEVLTKRKKGMDARRLGNKNGP